MSNQESATQARADKLALVDHDERIEVCNQILNIFKSLSDTKIITPEYEAIIRDEPGLPSKLDIKMITIGENKLDVILISILKEIYKMEQVGATNKIILQNAQILLSLTFEFQNQVDTMKQLDT